MEYEFINSQIPFQRKVKYGVGYKERKLPHKFFADFVVYNKIILEVKAITGIADEHIAQTINYLKVSNNKLGLLVKFGELKLNYKRLVL